MRLVFKNLTIVKYGLFWKTLLCLLNDIEEKKKQFGKANCYDFERIFFEMDKHRKGYFEKQEVTLSSMI
jgi:hypothetical protein